MSGEVSTRIEVARSGRRWRRWTWQAMRLRDGQPSPSQYERPTFRRPAPGVRCGRARTEVKARARARRAALRLLGEVAP